MTQQTLSILTISNLALLLILPVLYVLYWNTHPLFNGLYIFNVCVVWLKLISYHQVYSDVRYHIKKAKKLTGKKNVSLEDLPEHFGLPKQVSQDVLKYPNNLTLKQMCVFIFLPTLCF
jgi:hypothetical protein